MLEPDARSLVVRVWLPDRPGALGQVASRIGAVRGDVTAIDILERSAGRVVDELTVSLPGSSSVDLLAAEVGAVDGVSIEHIRTVEGVRTDVATDVLQIAVEVVEASGGAWVAALCDGVRRMADAEWAVAVHDGSVAHRSGQAPDEGWLLAFLGGAEHLDGGSSTNGPVDVLWAGLPRHQITIAAGRSQRPVHERERTRLCLLARVVDSCRSGEV